MRSVHFVCLFAILISMLVLAQSRRTIAQQRHPKATTIRRASSMFGLDFAPAVPYGSGGPYASSVAVADVNGDGKPDLLVGNYLGVGVLLGNGDGTFQAAVTYDSGGYGV
jgi:hypothetical protein